MPPAARMTDMHVCPKVEPGPVPHVGGPVMGTSATVMIGGLPAAVLGDQAICVGPPDSVAKGSGTVQFGGKPAATMGGSTQHGGTIVGGFPTVMVGG